MGWFMKKRDERAICVMRRELGRFLLDILFEDTVFSWCVDLQCR
jgi:hypothetical protein